MTEATVVNFFLTLRVLLVGGILLVLPRVTRKGLLFGVYVGEVFADGEEGRRLLRSWDLGCLMVMTVSLVVGLTISAAGWPVTGNLTGTAVLLLLALGNYIRLYSNARTLAPPTAARQAERAAATLQGGEPKGAVLAKLSLGICLLTSLVTIAYALVSHDAMPDRVPALSGLFGAGGATSDRSVISVMFFPTLNLLVSPLYALYALLTSRAKLSVREGPDGRSVEAQEGFRAANANIFSAAALLFCAFLTLLSVQLIRFQLSEIRSLGVAIWSVAGVLILYLAGNLVRILKRYGQGGARIEEASGDRPLAGGLADNARWVLGMFYVDRQDPSIMVEKRFGIGYTLNYGNRNAVLIVATFLLLTLSLAAIGLIGILS